MRRLWRWVEAMSLAGSVESCTAIFREIVAGYGVDGFASGEVDLACLERSTFFVVEWPDAWRKFYEDGQIKHDPVLRALERRGLPFTWTELYTDDQLEPGERRLLELGKAAGWREGLVVPIPRGARRFGLVSLARYGGSFTDEEKAELTLLSVYFHGRVRGLGAAIAFASLPAGIGKRVGEVLTLAAKGYTDKLIGKQLALSHETVREYMRIAKTKLHAGNKVEAVALAISLGLISL